MTTLDKTELANAIFFNENMVDADAYNTLQEAIDAATVLGVPVYLKERTYNLGTGSITIDATKTSLVGDNAILSWAGAPISGYGVKVHGNGLSYSGRHNLHRNVINGVRILGGGDANNTYAASAILLEGTATDRLNLIKLSGIYIQGFDYTIEFTDNVWRVTCEDISTVWGDIKTPSVVSDFGENMIFDKCMFADNSDGESVFYHGGWNFISCSIDNVCITARNDSIVTFISPHFENPNSSNQTYRYIRCLDNAIVNISGMNLVHNTPSSGARTEPLFENNSSNGGIFITGSRLGNFSKNTNYDTITNYNHQLLQSGSGHISANQSMFTSFDNYNYVLLGTAANVIQNGDFESGVDGWVKGNTYDGIANATMTADTLVSKTGTQSLRLESIFTSVNSGKTYVYTPIECRKIPVNAGDIVLCSFWRKTDFDNGTGKATYSLRFYNEVGEVVDDRQYSSLTVTTDWQNKQLASYTNDDQRVPAGACYVVLHCELGVSSGTVNMYLDEVIVNIIGR